MSSRLDAPLYIAPMSAAHSRFAHLSHARPSRFSIPTNNKARSKAPAARRFRKPDIHAAIRIPPWAASP
jgi:hypothetical protein